ncbi:MAG TPA: hypothetical protein VFB34_00350, partial [Chloroflexota bacterium]|nr:hypothetical protein [Chloroflexota bacterium]
MTVLQVCVVEAPEGAPGKVLSTYRAPVLGPRVGAGDAVTAYDVIGVGTERSPLVLADVAQALGRGARSIAKSVTVSQGDVVRRGQKLAGASGPFGMRRREALSPTDGVVAAFVEQHGTLLLRPPDREDTIRSVLPGKVTAVSRETIAVETSVHLLEGLSGFGPQAAGTLMAAGSRIFEEEIVRREAAPESEHDPILVAVGQLELSLLERLLD